MLHSAVHAGILAAKVDAVKVIIAGSRSITDPRHLHAAMEAAKYPISEVVCGGAHGADELGKWWAERHGVLVEMFPANWERYGKQAGFKRNQEMARYADAALVVWDGISRGTANMIYHMKKLKKPVYVHMVPRTKPEPKKGTWKPIQVPEHIL